MKKIILLLFTVFQLIGCVSPKNSYLVKIYTETPDELGGPSGYVTQKGDTIIPVGKYYYCYTDTIRSFGMVMENKTGKILGIDREGKELYEVFNYDNGPDYIQNGLFRIIKNGKIGYANAKGKIIIKPRYDCADPFQNGMAKVSDSCQTEKDSENAIRKSQNWYYINKKGTRAEK